MAKFQRLYDLTGKVLIVKFGINYNFIKSKILKVRLNFDNKTPLFQPPLFSFYKNARDLLRIILITNISSRLFTDISFLKIDSVKFFRI